MRAARLRGHGNGCPWGSFAEFTLGRPRPRNGAYPPIRGCPYRTQARFLFHGTSGRGAVKRQHAFISLRYRISMTPHSFREGTVRHSFLRFVSTFR